MGVVNHGLPEAGTQQQQQSNRDSNPNILQHLLYNVLSAPPGTPKQRLQASHKRAGPDNQKRCLGRVLTSLKNRL